MRAHQPGRAGTDRRSEQPYACQQDDRFAGGHRQHKGHEVLPEIFGAPGRGEHQRDEGQEHEKREDAGHPDPWVHIRPGPGGARRRGAQSSNPTWSTSRLAVLRCRTISVSGSESMFSGPSAAMIGCTVAPALTGYSKLASA